MTTRQQYEKWKATQEELRSAIDVADGQLQALNEQLNEAGCDDVDDAEQTIRKLTKQAKKLRTQIDRDIEQFQHEHADTLQRLDAID